MLACIGCYKKCKICKIPHLPEFPMWLDLLSSDFYLVFHIKINDDSCNLPFDALFISLDPKHNSRYNSQIQSKDW